MIIYLSIRLKSTKRGKKYPYYYTTGVRIMWFENFLCLKAICFPVSSPNSLRMFLLIET